MSAWIPRVLIVAFVLGIGGAVISISVGDGGPQSVEVEGRVDVQKLIAGIRQDGERLGDPDAPVEIDLFTDLRDEGAARFQVDVVDPVIVDYVREGRAQINLRHFSFQRTAVTEAAIAADAAGEQGHQWQYAELVLRNLENAGPRGAEEDFLNIIAEVTPGLEKDEWDPVFDEELEAHRDDPGFESTPYEDGMLANELKLPGEPALILTGPGGSETLDSTPTLADFEASFSRVELPPQASP